MRHPWSGLGGLPRGIWVLFAVSLVNRLGTMFLPFLVLYLTRHLGFTPGHAASMIALYGAVGIAASPLAGRLADHWGAERVMKLSLFSSGVLLALFPLARSPAGVAAMTIADRRHGGGVPPGEPVARHARRPGREAEGRVLPPPPRHQPRHERRPGGGRLPRGDLVPRPLLGRRRDVAGRGTRPRPAPGRARGRSRAGLGAAARREPPARRPRGRALSLFPRGHAPRHRRLLPARGGAPPLPRPGPRPEPVDVRAPLLAQHPPDRLLRGAAEPRDGGSPAPAGRSSSDPFSSPRASASTPFREASRRSSSGPWSGPSGRWSSSRASRRTSPTSRRPPSGAPTWGSIR